MAALPIGPQPLGPPLLYHVRTMSTITAAAVSHEELADLASEAGLDLIRVSSPGPFSDVERVYLERYEQGLLGEMKWITPERIHAGCTPEELLPGVRSIVTAACSYNTSDAPAAGGLRGRVARYALNEDYHDTIKRKLRSLHHLLEERLGHTVRTRLSIDSGPIVDRAVAARAGLGWYGKNTNILTPELGSWVLLGSMLLDVPLPVSPPLRKSCGGCTRCLAACPTGALTAPGVLDSRRCISYLTIELKGPIPRELRPLVGSWIFGCDICQEVCPVNLRAPVPDHAEYRPRPGWGRTPDLPALMALTDEEFRELFRGSPVKRAKRRGLLRNVAVALGNSHDPAALPPLSAALHDHEPLVRGHAAWALGELGVPEGAARLAAMLPGEPDEWVREEMTLALERLEGRQ